MTETFYFDFRDDGERHGNGAATGSSQAPGMPGEAATRALQLRARALHAAAKMSVEKFELESANRCRQR